LDFWQGSLTGVEDYASEYRKAEKMYDTLLNKVRKARAEAELKDTEKALTRAIQLFNINDPEQVREVTTLKMKVKELRA
jgi:CHASE3 domain sensor protein